MRTGINFDLGLIDSDLFDVSKERSQLLKRHCSGIGIPYPDDDSSDEGEQDEEEIELPARGSNGSRSAESSALMNTTYAKATGAAWVYTMLDNASTDMARL